jgi:hypothetical protein
MSALPMPRPADGPWFDSHGAGIDIDTRTGAVTRRLMAGPGGAAGTATAASPALVYVDVPPACSR